MQPIYALNPMVGVLEAFRWMLLDTDPVAWTFIVPAVACVLLPLTRRALLPSRGAELRRRDLSRMDPVISVEGVSKRYWLGSGQAPDSFSERLEQMVRAPARWVGRG